MGIANIINNSTTTSGGEIIRELVNASDGAGLHFDGAAGNVSGTSNLALGSKYSAEFVINYTGSSNNRLFDINGDTRFIVEFNRSGFTGKIAGYDSDFYELCDIPDDGVFHLTVTVDGTAVSAYVNGNLAGTATKNNSTSIDTVTQWTIGANDGGSFGHFEGTIYRARFYNKALEPDEVRTAYERADVDYADQYGSQGSPYTSDFSSGTDSFSSYGGAAVAHSGSQINITSFGATGRGIYRSLTFSEPNKKYRVKLTGSVAAGTKNIGVGIASAGADDAANRITLTTTPTTHTIEVTYPSGSQINVASQDAVDTTVSITSLVIEQIGAVSDYDLAYAQPALSTLIQDRSNAADGVASSTGVTQVQPITQLNSTSARIGSTQLAAGTSPYIPADGDIIASGGVGVGAAPGAGGHGLTVDKVVNDDWVAKIKNSSNTTPYGLQVDCQGSNAVTALAVYAGSSPNNTTFTIKPSGVIVGDTPNAISGGIPDLHVNRTAGGTLVLSRTNGDNNGTLGTVRFGNTDTDSTLANIIATEAGTKTSSKLEFQTQTTGAAAATRLTIDSTGKTTANALKVLDPTHGRYFDFVLDSSASYLDVSHALNVRVNGASSLTNALTISSTGLATFDGDTKLGNGLVSNYVKHVAGLDDTVAISFTFPSQGTRWINHLIELRVAMGDDSTTTAFPTFLRYAIASLTSINGITQMDASLGSGITVGTSSSGTTFTVTLTEGSAISMDSVTVFATVTSGHGDAKCTGMTVA